MPETMTTNLPDWHEHADDDHNLRIFPTTVEVGNDVFIRIMDRPNDKFPLTTLVIENDGGKLVLRIWEDEGQDPIHEITLPVNRYGRGYDLATGEDVQDA